jgi:myo-inositol-1(or 4)-monophosphatase
MTELNLAEMLNQSKVIAAEAGALLREHFARPKKSLQKSTSIDLVTEADRKSEALIVDRLNALFPDHHVVGEEGGDYADGNAANAYRWYIDPLDGTTNFAHGLPHFAVNMSLVGEDNQLLVGVTHDVMRDESFAAAAGLGATLNDVPLQVSNTPTLAQSIVVTGFPYDKWQDPENNTAQWAWFAVRTQGVRRLGAAALDLAYIAAGRIDGYWEQKLHLWDALAGVLLVREAGGKVTDYLGGQAEIMQTRPRVVATNGRIHDEMLEVLKQGDAAPRPAGA